jgi:pimeloyl-ACP methyl ester carboxylesterase
MHYEAEGRGPAVVLIPAFSMDLRMWEPQVQGLRSRYRVIRYDLRGHGQSAAITRRYAAVADLRDVLDALAVREAVLVGLSAGAQIAVDFALSYPDRVTKLVLASPGLGGYVARDPFDWMRPVMEAASAGDAKEAATRWAATPLMAIPTNASGDSLMRRIALDNARIWLERSNPSESLDPPAIARLSEIRVTTLIVVGERDLPDIHRTADTLTACIGNAEKRVMREAGHMVNLAFPAEFTALVTAFVEASPGVVARTAPSCVAGRPRI